MFFQHVIFTIFNRLFQFINKIGNLVNLMLSMSRISKQYEYATSVVLGNRYKKVRAI